jgi:hypothetical protein
VIAAVEAELTTRLSLRLAAGDWLPEEGAAAARLAQEQFTPLALE